MQVSKTKGDILIDVMPKLDTIYDDLVYLKDELNDLRNRYEKEQQELSKNIEFMSKFNEEYIIKFKEIFEERLVRVNEIITEIDDNLIDVDIGLVIVGASKLGLDENASIDNQFVVCCEKVKQIHNECDALFKH